MSLEKLKNKKIVFFGDSITDSNRRLNPKYPMGFGFVSMVDTDYSINHSYANITLINQGVSGDKTEELLARINQDVIDLNPDVVILLIGINDIWHRYDQGLEINVKEIVDRINEVGYGFSYSSSYPSGIRAMAHSNSFCSEAIADCLEFIKRNSVLSYE